MRTLGKIALVFLIYTVFLALQPPKPHFMTRYKNADRVRHPDAPLSRQWMEYAMEIIKFERDPNPPRVGRFYAYVASVFSDVLDKTGSAEQASVATASLINSLYPTYRAKTNEFLRLLGHRNVRLTGETSTILSSYRRRATTDGFSLPWDGRLPDGPNLWYRRVHLVDSPRAGEWETWILPSLDQLSIPIYPKPGTLADRYEIARVRFETDTRNDQDMENIYIWNGGPAFRKIDNDKNVTPSGIWMNVLFVELVDVTDPEYARIQKIIAQSIADSFIACWKIKFQSFISRPSMQIPNLSLGVADPEFPSYPSGHSCIGETAAVVLSHLKPEKIDTWLKVSDSTRDARLTAGVHWEFDTTQGANLGQQVGEKIIQALGIRTLQPPISRRRTYDREKNPLELRIHTAALDIGRIITTTLRPLREKINALRAEARLKRAARENPESPEAHMALAQFLRSRGRTDEAEPYLLKAAELDPAADTPLVELGNYYRHKTERFADAERVLLEALSINPNRYWAYVQLGKLYVDQGRVSEAERMFRKAIELNPKDIGIDGPFDPLLTLYRTQSKRREAITLATRLITLDPNPRLYTVLAAVFLDVGDAKRAITSLHEGLVVYPKSRILYEKLVNLYRSIGQAEEAERVMKASAIQTAGIIPF